MVGLKLATLAELHRATLSDLDSKIASLMEQKTDLMGKIEKCDADLKRMRNDREALARAEELYRAQLKSLEMSSGIESISDSPVEHRVRLPKARVGPQRYHMLKAIMEHEVATIDNVVAATGFQPRRVRYQLASDVEKNILIMLGEGFKLTAEGIDLLKRFENSRHSRGVPLPTLEEARAESEGSHQGNYAFSGNEADVDGDEASEAEAPE